MTKITHADGSYKLFSYDKFGDKLWEEDELRHRTNYTYDEYGRVLTVTSPLNHTTTNDYTVAAKTSTITTSKLPFSTTLPSGKQTTFEYDTNWRKRFVHVAAGTGGAATSEYRYDEGQANVGHLTTMLDPKGNATTYGYDLRDRQTSVTDALGHTNRVVYDTRGVKTTETHANNELIEYDGYDAMNRLTHKKVHRDASTIDRTSIGYDCAGNQIATVDENGNTYAYSFDNMNRPTVMTYPNGKTEVHAYDPAGDVQTYTNRSGAVQTFAYDNRNRPVNFAWSNEPSGQHTSSETTSYDAASRKTEIDNDDATITLGYDDENHLTSQIEKEITSGVGDNVARTVTYTYDADGNRQNIQYPSGAAFNDTYTQRNQVATINPGLSGGNPIVTYTFDLSGNITSRALDNGTSSAYSVDQVNRDTAVAHSLSGTNRRFDYAYNTVNDITAVQQDGNVNDSDGFEYDMTQQITKFHQNGHYDSTSGMVTTPQHDNTMTFDGCGNRTQLNASVQTYNNMNQPNGIPHDDDGDVQMYNGSTYTYDAQNRLRRATSAGFTEDFYYDGLNRQVARVTSGAASTPTPSPMASPLPTATPTISPFPTIPPTPTVSPSVPSLSPTPTVSPSVPSLSPTPTIPPLGTPTPIPTATPGATPQCSPVTFSESFNNASSTYSVSMSTTTSGATIFYTIDGSTPTHNGGTATGTTSTYTAPVNIGNCGDHNFNALAYKSGNGDSTVSNQDYNLGNCGPPLGASTSSQSTTVTTVFSVWDGDWAILEEYDASGNRVEGYVQGYHGLVKTLVANVYYYQDELGSTSHITDVHGALIEYYRYDLYGKPQYFNSTSQQLTSSTYNVVVLGNGGARWRPELGLYDDRNRFMSPDLGRFLQPDPIGFKGDASNLYRYCGNDWANRTDPMGLDSVIVVYPDYRVDIGHGFHPQWGHAGLLTIDNHTGATHYYEYGRYHGVLQGLVSDYPARGVQVNAGHVNRESVVHVLQDLSRSSGQGGRVEGAYVHTTDQQQAKINAYAEKRLGDNTNPNRTPYHAKSNSCLDFGRDAVAAGGKKVPAKSDARPRHEINNLQRRFERISAPPPPPPAEQPQASHTEAADIGGVGFFGLGPVFFGKVTHGAMP